MAKKRVKVPKRIAGVKIPKPIRKGPVGDFLNSSGGQVLVAEALLIAGSALLAKRSNPDSRIGELMRHPWDQLKEAGRGTAASTLQTGEAIGDARHRLAGAFSAALQAFRAALDKDDERVNGRLASDDFNDSDADDDVLRSGDLEPNAGSGKKKRTSRITPDVMNQSVPPPPAT